MTVLLAVSAGVDSLYMAYKAPELWPGASFAVAHCNFALRGEESDGDEAFVRDWCRSASLPLHVRRFDTSGYAASHGISIEMAARELRYAWFAELCRIGGYDAVAVAHNADDNAETMILNLLRGTSSRGLRGMSADSTVTVAETASRCPQRAGTGQQEGTLRILRPLLGIPRAEIEAWMRSEGHAWREDNSNAGDAYKRNLVRHRVLPVFGQINPSYLETLALDMKHIAQEDDIAREWFLQHKDAVVGADGSIDVGALKSCGHPGYMLWRLTEGRLEASQVQSLLKWTENPVSGKRFGPYITTSRAIIPDEGAPLQWRVEVFDKPAGFEVRQPRGVLVMDADVVGESPVIRPWQEGDWMKPLGMRGRKKLSDLFTDLHWSLADKRQACVMAWPGGDSPGPGTAQTELKGPAGRRVAALLGVRIDDDARVTASTRRILRISPATGEKQL